MPKKAIDYSKIVIYKIVCNDLNIKDVYVGSTTDFRKRKNQHKTNCCNVDGEKYNLKVYQMIRANGGWYNWTMIEIEKYTTCLDGNEARARERHWIELLSANMNIQVPGRLREEWDEANKDKIREQRKIWEETNKDKIREQRKIWDEANKDKIREQKKIWEEANRDKRNARKKELRKLKKQSLINNV
jgi:hypothetical protein